MRKATYLRFLKKSMETGLAKAGNSATFMPYKYTFILTNVCDSRCRTCGIWDIYRQRPQLLQLELGSEEYRKIFGSIGKDAFWVSFSGGEPFLRKDILELARSCKEAMPNLLFFSLPTNGIATDSIIAKTRQLLEIMEPVNVAMTVSIDGTEAVHDDVRGRAGFFQKSVRTYELLRELESDFGNFKVGIQFTLSKFNAGNLEDFIARFGNGHRIAYTFAQEASYFANVGGGLQFKDVETDVMKRGLDTICKNHRIRSAEDVLYRMYLKLAAKFYRNPGWQVLPCYAGYASLFMDPYGNVYPCSYFNYALGNLRDHKYDMRAIARGQKANAARDLIKDSKCPKCWTNCEGLPTLLQQVPIAVAKSFL